MAQPRSLLQQPRPWRGQEAHFRGKLARLLAAVIKVASQLAIEKYHCFPNSKAILCSTERQNIHARFPGDFLWTDSERNDSICKTRAVHMHAQAQAAGGIGQYSQFVQRIYRAQFRRL